MSTQKNDQYGTDLKQEEYITKMVGQYRSCTSPSDRKVVDVQVSLAHIASRINSLQFTRYEIEKNKSG